MPAPSDIDWLAFAKVFAAALAGAVSIVLFYSLGMRMLVRAGQVRGTPGSGFAKALVGVPESEPRHARQQSSSSPEPAITDSRRRLALTFAVVCFTLCASAVIGWLLLILAGR